MLHLYCVIVTQYCGLASGQSINKWAKQSEGNWYCCWLVNVSTVGGDLKPNDAAKDVAAEFIGLTTTITNIGINFVYGRNIH